MLRLSLAFVAVCLVSASMGCSMCCAPFDTAFAAYGGAIERDDRYHGRVGSAFDPAMGQVVPYELQDDSAIFEPDTGFAPLEAEPDVEFSEETLPE